MIRFVVTLAASIFISIPLCAQNFGAEDPVRFTNTGVGAAALGMGGAYVAIAEDLSAVYWNPAGIVRQKGASVFINDQFLQERQNFGISSFYSGSSRQDFSGSSNTIDAIAFSYTVEKDDLKFTPVFSWNRTDPLVSSFELDAPNSGETIEPIFGNHYAFENIYEYSFSGGEDEFAFGAAVKFRSVSIGFIWNYLTGSRTEEFFRNSTNIRLDEPLPPILTRSLRREEASVSANSVKFGILSNRERKVSAGATIRLPFTREIELTAVENLQITGNGINRDQTSQESAAVRIENPLEFSAGIAIKALTPWTIASSFTFAAWKDTTQEIQSNSSFFPFPTFGTFTNQSNLYQWRIGSEYQTSHGIAIRNGYMLDAQVLDGRFYYPAGYKKPYFHALSFGGGFRISNFRWDVAYMRHWGTFDLTARLGGISDHDVKSTHGDISRNRLIFSFQWNAS